MKNTVLIWGKIHGSNVDVKLHREDGNTTYALRKARKWMEDNKRYYSDMRLSYFHDSKEEA
jgi:hypothetical protein